MKNHLLIQHDSLYQGELEKTKQLKIGEAFNELLDSRQVFLLVGKKKWPLSNSSHDSELEFVHPDTDDYNPIYIPYDSVLLSFCYDNREMIFFCHDSYLDGNEEINSIKVRKIQFIY